MKHVINRSSPVQLQVRSKELEQAAQRASCANNSSLHKRASTADK